MWCQSLAEHSKTSTLLVYNSEYQINFKDMKTNHRSRHAGLDPVPARRN